MLHTRDKNIRSNNPLYRFGWEIWGHYHRTLTAFLKLVLQVRPHDHSVKVSSARDVPKQGRNIYAHVRPYDHLICLSEHEVRDHDMKERLHFDQREALAYARLQKDAFVKMVKVLVQYDRSVVREAHRRTT